MIDKACRFFRRVIASGLACAICLFPPPALSQESNGGGIVSGRIKSVSSSGSFDYRPDIVGSFQTGYETPAVELDYSLWTLAGSMVWGFRARTSPLVSISFAHQEGLVPILSVKLDRSLPDNTVRPKNLSGDVHVSPDIMNAAYIYDFVFLARLLDRYEPASFFEFSKGVGQSIYSIYRSHQGISAPPGKWGWTVPGSPKWAKTFSYRDSPPLIFDRESLDEDHVGADKARDFMRTLVEEFADKEKGPIWRLEIVDFDLRVGDLLFEIWKQQPDALHGFYDVQSEHDEQLANIIQGYSASLRREGPTPALAREGKEIDAVIRRHEQKLSEGLIATWREMSRSAQSALADRRAEAHLRQLAPRLAEKLSEGHLELPTQLRADFDEAQRFFDTEENVSESMHRRWAALESAVNRDVRTTLIAERYRDHGNGTVTDTQTGLQWMRCSYGMTWNRDDAKCEGAARRVFSDKLPQQVSYANYEDWRIPTEDELANLIYCRHHNHPDYMRMISNPAPKFTEESSCFELVQESYRYASPPLVMGVQTSPTESGFDDDEVRYLSSTVSREGSVSHAIDFWEGTVERQWRSWSLSNYDDPPRVYYLIFVRDAK